MVDVPTRLIDAAASQRNLADHLAPIWLALPEDRQGRFLVGQRHLGPYMAARWGINATLGQPHTPGGPILLANHHDLTQTDPTRPAIYVEHGAGQRYEDYLSHPSYSGGRDGYRDQVALFLTLNDTTAARERVTYPDKPVVVIGSPRLDVLAALQRTSRSGASRPRVGLCWHWRAGIVPETETCWPEYRHALPALLDNFELLGSGHPRIFAELEPRYVQLGIEPVRDFEHVVERSDVVAFDNSSAGPEAAACGIPLVFLNSSRYRRDVSHDGRFWEWPKGQVSCDSPDQMGEAITEAVMDPPAVRAARQGMVDSIYPPSTRGCAAQLAVDAICAMFPGA